MSSIRIFSEKKSDVNAVASHLLTDIKTHLVLNNLTNVRVLNCFDIFDEEDVLTPEYQQTLVQQVLTDPAVETVFDVPPVDVLVAESSDHFRLALEYLPGQFDQRADAAEQCARLLSSELDALTITSATCYVFYGAFSEQDKEKIKNYLLNPIEMRVKNLEKLSQEQFVESEPVQNIENIVGADDDTLVDIISNMGLSMTLDDLKEIQGYFTKEGRAPTDTEIRVLDTYWSDHCRHTTFMTAIETIDVQDESQKKAYEQYLEYRESSGISSRPVTLMDLATINARYLRKHGKLENVEISDEVNACSVFVDVEADAQPSEKWLLQFKNETHNHPTEIEPFGGASTCLGGAIRDPLSGRAYVYQAARVSGAADPTLPIESTLPNKLSQYRICTEAAKGFASYGNQIGLTTTQVSEVYHPGYVAKRMEVGAVVAAAPAENVKRLAPKAGDKIILVGGKTGRDGVGGASGSSKSHSESSLSTCGAEVQKGNPPIERAIQRLFRDGDVAKVIKKCNDFGAGGVCVAIGELADGVTVNLDVIPTKYQGLSGTELSISESQERMAVIVSADNVEMFLEKALSENNDATVVGEVTDLNKFTIMYKGKPIVDLQRDFIDSAGAKQTQSSVTTTSFSADDSPFRENKPVEAVVPTLLGKLRSLGHSSQKGLQDQFDSNVGASTVLLPYGGKAQTSPAEGSVQLLPKFNAKTASTLTWGFDPQLSEWSPYHGGMYAIVHSVCKQVALGARLENVYLSLQEYFEKLHDMPEKWGKPFSALLGAFKAQAELGLGAIGGKDSMSGSYSDGEQEVHVPPTLISFAVSHLAAADVVESTLTKADEFIYLLKHESCNDLTPNFAQLIEHFNYINEQRGNISAMVTAKQDGYLPELVKASFGNTVGFKIDDDNLDFNSAYGDIVIVSRSPLNHDNLTLLGKTTSSDSIIINDEVLSLKDAYNAYIDILSPIYPHLHNEVEEVASGKVETYAFSPRTHKNPQVLKSPASGQPRVFLPVFAGMNSEYDLENAFKRVGAKCKQKVFVNQTSELTQASIDMFAQQLDKSQILAISGGFSLGDEPNGSGKYIAMVLRTPQLQEKIQQFLERDGLILGICNGFQALIKSGLLPYGEVLPRDASHPTLEENTTGRHIARLAMTRVCQTDSPWLSDFELGEIHDVAFSHGEGRFIVDEQTLSTLTDNGQIAFQYCDSDGNASLSSHYNPNGSGHAIEGIISPCGKVMGKMGHSERANSRTYKNYPDFRQQNIFSSAVKYFK